MIKKHMYFVILFVFLIFFSICPKCYATDLGKTGYYEVFDEQRIDDSSHVSYDKSEYKQNKYKESKYDAISSNSHVFIILVFVLFILVVIYKAVISFFYEDSDNFFGGRYFPFVKNFLKDNGPNKMTKEKIQSMDWFYADEKTKDSQNREM